MPSFDCFYETGNKYLLSYFLAQQETELLNTAITIFFKCLITVWQELHGTVCYVDQIDEYFNSFITPNHVTAQEPEGFLFIVTDPNIPSEPVQESWYILHSATSRVMQHLILLPCAEDAQLC